MAIMPTRVALLAALLLTIGVAWYVDGRGRWREIAAKRLLYGVPWGTLVTSAVVVGFYLVVQGGFRHWTDPVTLPFVTWSYFYPMGLLTAGIAHAGPEHLVSNVTATLVFGAIAEYAWGHYPRRSRPGAPTAYSGDRNRRKKLVDGGRTRLVDRPWIRAVVIFPVALLVAAFLTAVFSLGPGLGFSGAVFAIVGFAVVLHPLATVVGLVVTSTLALLIEALAQPIVRETVEIGPPVPPGWAGIGFHAHLLGFLIGAVAAVALLSRRRRRPSFAAITFGVFVVGAVQALWLLVWTANGDEFVLYQGIGVTMVLVITLVIAGAVAGSDRGIPRPFARFERVPSRRTLAIGWLALVVLGLLLGFATVLAVGETVALSIGMFVVIAAVLAIPALPPLLPDRIFPTPVSRRHAATTCLVVATVLAALVGIPMGLTVVDDDAMPEEGAVVVDDYAVTYAENTTSEQRWIVDVGNETEFEPETVSGVILVSDERELWTVGVTDDILAFEGEGNVTVGGIGWRETVHVERTGWDVLGNDTVYAVDLRSEGGDETLRAFTSEPARANAELDGYAFEVIPTDEGFDLDVKADGDTVATGPIPEANESMVLRDIEFSTVEVDDTTYVMAEADDTRLQIAERETYPSVPSD